MAMAGRIRSAVPLLSKVLRSETLSGNGSSTSRSLLCSELSRNYSAAATNKEQKIKPPLVFYGLSGNYSSALYIAAAKANVLEKVDSELSTLLEALKNSPTFSQFAKDLSVPAATRVKAIDEVCTEAKFSNITKNFLLILAEKGRLKNLDSIAKRFAELTMAHRGDVKAIVTTVIPLPPQEEKELKETLVEVFGKGKNVLIEQKIDPSILGGLVVEFGQKVFDMSIKSRAQQMERFLRDPANIV